MLPRKSVQILLVEDSPTDVLLTQEVIASFAEFQLTHVERLADAVALLAMQRFDVVLLDLGLPDSQGVATLSRLRQAIPLVPVVVMTARDDEELALHAVQAGAQDYLVKSQIDEAIIGRSIRYAVERYRAQAALQEVSDLNHQIISSAQEGIVVLDRDLRYRIWNTYMERLSGLRSDEVAGKHPWVVFPVITETMARAYLDLGLAGETTIVPDTYMEAPAPGRSAWVAQEISPLRNNVGKVAGVICTVRDITRRKQREDELRESEERFRQLTENIREVFWLNDPFSHAILYVSPAFADVWGCDCQSLYDRPSLWWEAIHPDDRDRVRTAGATQEVLGRYDETYRISRADGSIRWIHDRGFPVRNAQGEVYRIAGVAEDVTESKLATEALHERSRLAALTADVGLALTQTSDLREMLRKCAQAVVTHLNAVFARIWTLHAEDDVLELEASAGLYTHIDGPHSRVPVGQFKIGLIAQEKLPHLTNDVLHDPRVGNQEWARREGMVAFAGYPLLVEDRLVGVIALFARHTLNESVLDAIKAVADGIAVGIERKRAETERDRLLARLQMQIDRMPLGYLLTDANDRIIDWNSTAERIFGYRKEEVLGLGPPYEKILPQSAWTAAREVVARLRTGDMSAHAINENRTREGRTIVCEWFNTPLLDRDGRFLGAISLAQDITERRSLEEQVRQARNRLQYVVGSSPVVLFTLAIAGDQIQGISWISENVLDLFGHRAETALDPAWWMNNIHPEDRDYIAATTHSDLITQGRTTHEYRFRHGNGKYLWTRGELRLIRNAQGDPVEVVGSWSDITGRRTLEEQFRQAQKVEAVGQLAGGVAHDFNNLLTIINGYSELILAELPADHGMRGLIHEISQAGERAASLTRQLLAFSRKSVLETKILSLNNVVTDTSKMLQRLIGEDIDLNSVQEPDLKQVKADPGQVEQVLINLAVNARDAMPRGGQLTVETANVTLDETYTRHHPDLHPGRYVLLAVTDTGTGMDEATKGRIFEPFFTTKEAGKGTGLGLATVFGIVKQSGGHIAVYTELGVGTTFKVYLPQIEEQASPNTLPASPKPVPRGTETILLVEDEPALRALAAYVLGECGHKILQAGDGEKALRVAAEHQGPIHLLVTDVVMPRLSGRQLVEQLVPTRPDLKVLYLSGYTDDAVVRHGILQAEMAFLQKPFTPGALVQKVRDVLDQRHPQSSRSPQPSKDQS